VSFPLELELKSLQVVATGKSYRVLILGKKFLKITPKRVSLIDEADEEDNFFVTLNSKTKNKSSFQKHKKKCINIFHFFCFFCIFFSEIKTNHQDQNHNNK